MIQTSACGLLLGGCESYDIGVLTQLGLCHDFAVAGNAGGQDKNLRRNP